MSQTPGCEGCMWATLCSTHPSNTQYSYSLVHPIKMWGKCTLLCPRIFHILPLNWTANYYLYGGFIYLLSHLTLTVQMDDLTLTPHDIIFYMRYDVNSVASWKRKRTNLKQFQFIVGNISSAEVHTWDNRKPVQPRQRACFLAAHKSPVMTFLHVVLQ